jgi:hypothetical protein
VVLWGVAFLIEALNVFGKLFQEGHGHSLWSYQKTVGQWTWANYPWDPTADALNELLPKLIANLHAAIDCCAEISGGVVVLPAEVHAHMYRRVEEHPLSLLAHHAPRLRKVRTKRRCGYFHSIYETLFAILCSSQQV